MGSHVIVGGGGCRLRVDDAGNPAGRPVVFLHGISSCRLAWLRQLRSPLADTLRLVTVDLRGHGGSDRPHDAYADPRLWAADVAAVIDTLGLNRPVLVGWSYGGVVICDYLAVYGPAALSAVNLVGATTALGAPVLDYLGPQFAALGRPLLSADAETSVAALDAVLGLCTVEPLTEEERYLMLGWSCAVPPHVRAGLLRRTLDHDNLLRGLQLPVLISHGEGDLVFARSLAERHAALLPDGRTSWYADVGHMPFWEATGRFNRELLQLVRDTL